MNVRARIRDFVKETAFSHGIIIRKVAKTAEIERFITQIPRELRFSRFDSGSAVTPMEAI